MRPFLLYVTLIILSILSPLTIAAAEDFTTAPLIADHMVLQQRHRVPLWGWGTPGARVTATASWGASSEARVGRDGRWILALKTPDAGGPYALSFTDGTHTRTVTDVLVGEVWLASGQSNMEMPLEGWPPSDTVLHSAAEIRAARNPHLRMFTVRRAIATAPAAMCEGAWMETTPETAGTFSATAYFFGRAIQETLHVPVGIIHASWGGTPAEAWTSAKTLASFDQFKAALPTIARSAESLKALDAWLSTLPRIVLSDRPAGAKYERLDCADSAFALPAFSDTAWRTMELPQVWEKTALGEFDGVVWFRRSVPVPASWTRMPLTLMLGPIDDMDETYVNGVRIGATLTGGMWKEPRAYGIPSAVMTDTMLTIAVRVLDFGGGGGIYGTPASLALRNDSTGETLPLAGAWNYVPSAEYRNGTLYVYGEKGYDARPTLPAIVSAYSPTALYNGMIAPLAPYAVEGAIWYQGESNVGAYKWYRKLFTSMIADWRDAFNARTMPFYFVQIAPYEYSPGERSEMLREAQLQSLALAHTGMAVTMDIGNPKNIHPSNKQEVGARLARWALAKTYGRSVPYSGPLYRSMRRAKNALILSFDHADGGLVVKEHAAGSGFMIAGSDRHFKPAHAAVQGGTLVVSSPGVARPVAVRYAFTNTSEGTLFNGAGLPSPSFRTDAWSE